MAQWFGGTKRTRGSGTCLDSCYEVFAHVCISAVFVFAFHASAGAQESVDADSARRGWAKIVVIDGPHTKGGLLQAAFSHLAADGVDEKTAAKTLSALSAYIETQTRQGKNVSICLGMTIDSIEAALSSQWSAEDTVRLMLSLQREIDKDERPPLRSFQDAIGRVKRGALPGEVLGQSGGPVGRRPAP